jgi:CBS domain containing-hemolysin-like protein
MTLLLVYLFTALIFSFLCSLVEATLLSIPISFLKAKVRHWDKNAIKFIELKEDINKPISAILTINTIAHTVWAAWVWSQATIIFWEAYFWIISAILTLLILIFTEIIPKTIWATYYKELSLIAFKIIKVMMFITYPFILISVYISRIFTKEWINLTTSREEISALANIWTEEWIFLDKENKIIQNLIKLRNITLYDIMTPRVVVVSANEEMTLQEFLNKKDFLHFSRIPIYNNTTDNITWYVFRELVFEKLAEDQFNLKLKDIKREIICINESKTLFNAWEQLLSQKEHIALVIDSYWWMDGVITLEDIIETLLWFEILDEKDKIEDMQKYALEKWKIRQKKYNYLYKKEDEIIIPDENCSTPPAGG